MSKKLCVNCMKGFLDENRKCDTCGVCEDDIQTSQRHLPPRTILRGKYLVGKVIGEGGFGITYLGYDLDLDICVAIKEFCPRDYAGREVTDGLTITPFDRESAEFFKLEKDKFINEAKRLAKFRGEQGIVSVLDYFPENGTAYIVMEYINGTTLKKYQQQEGKVLSVETVLTLMKPVMESLGKMHAAGIIHRDISPDNIMISNDGSKVYLIDFGTAREAAQDGERSLSVYKKSGYTPIEQQSTSGVQGAWTDVYAMCATIYRCITNRAIPEATERLLGEEVIKPSEFGVSISENVEQALMHGLALKPEERPQSMQKLMGELDQKVQVQSQLQPQPKPEYKTAIVKKKVEQPKSSKEGRSCLIRVKENKDDPELKKHDLQKQADAILKKSRNRVMFWMMLMYGMSSILSAEYGAFDANNEFIFGVFVWCIPVVIELVLLYRQKVYRVYSGILVSVVWFVFWAMIQNLDRPDLSDEYIQLHFVIFAIGWALICFIWRTGIQNVHTKIMPLVPGDAEVLLLIENMSAKKYPISSKKYREYYYKNVYEEPDISKEIKEQWKEQALKSNLL